MAKMTVKGLDEFIDRLEALGRDPEETVKRVMYVGAGVVADAIRSGVGSMPVDESKGTRRNPKRGVTGTEKSGLLAGIGISHMQTESGKVNLAIGFNGENANGKKNTTVMRRAESGTSYQQKTPTVRPAVNRSKSAAMDAMQKAFKEELENVIEGRS